MTVRILPAQVPVVDQVDFFQADFFTRVTGLDYTDVTLEVFFINALLSSWDLASGVSVPDGQVVSGHVYFNEMTPIGYYSVRFRPNAVGFWRVAVSYTIGAQQVALDYDIVPPGSLTNNVGSGISASFFKP